MLRQAGANVEKNRRLLFYNELFCFSLEVCVCVCFGTLAVSIALKRLSKDVRLFIAAGEAKAHINAIKVQ